MATTLNEAEALPDEYPHVFGWEGEFHRYPNETSVHSHTAWQRIEWWVNHRWTARGVTYIAEGPGEWTARLRPFTITTSEVWHNDAWQAVQLQPSPLGGVILPGAGPYRITGTAGDGTPPPEAVREAWRRLNEYLLAAANSKYNESAATEDIATGWAARQMHLSGAADLLRPWRNLR